MAGNQEDMYKFTLQFNQEWPLHQIIRAGRSKDPMNKNLRIGTGDEYQDALESGNEPGTKDFYTDRHGLIDPGLSWGLSAYTDETRLREVLGDVKNQTLWRVGLSDDATHIFYPSEMQLKPDNEDPKHVGINPTQKVRPETLKEMLRCLPWVKLYPKDTQEEGKKKAK